MEFNVNIQGHVHHYHHGSDDKVLRILEKIMAKLDDYIAQQTAFNEQISTDVGTIATSVAAIDADVTVLNQKITDLMTLEAVTPEQKAALDGLAAAGTALAAKTKAASTAASALDERTPPPAPV